MDKKEIIEKLRAFGLKQNFEQRDNRKEIIELFNELCEIEDLTQEEFGKALDGVVFFAEMFYRMIRR